VKNNEFKQEANDFVTKPLTWKKVYAAWDEIYLTWDELRLSLEELVRLKSPCKQESALKILEGWFLAHAEHLPFVFENTTRYRSIVVQIALRLLYPDGNPIVINWLNNKVIGNLKSWRIPGYGTDDLRQEAHKHLIDKVINDIRWIKREIEPYLKTCVKNLLANLYNKEWAQKRTGRKRDDQERREPETIIWLKKTLEEKNYLPVTEISGSLEPEEQIPNLVLSDLRQLITEENLGILIKTSQRFSQKEIATSMGIDERTVRRRLEKMKSNEKLRRYYRQI